MESLSPSQIRDINSLYSKMYEPEGELVERYLSEDEITAAANAYPAIGPEVFNPQQQVPMTWSSDQ